MLVVSHDRTFLTNVCSDVIHMHSQRLTSYRGNYEVGVTACYIVLGNDQLVLHCVMQTFVQTKTERLKNQQREYEAQMQYRQHLQVNATKLCRIYKTL